VAPPPPSLDVFVTPVTDGERAAAFVLCQKLRDAGFSCDTDFEQKSLKAIFKGADKRGVRLMLILGPDEVAQGKVKLKDLAARAESDLANDAGLPAALRQRLGR
jgi:histidyl-tRNA synthetase